MYVKYSKWVLPNRRGVLMELINPITLKRDLSKFYDNEVTARQLIDNQPTINTDDFSRRTISQCLTEDYCKGWNDCCDTIMKKLEELK